MLIRCSKESQYPAEWALCLRLNSPREQERHNVTVITVGSKYYSLCSVSSSLSHANPEQPFCTLTNKVRGKYICKEVFLRLYPACVFIIASLLLWFILHEFAYDHTTILFVDIYVNTWFILFVSALTALHSMFLNDGKVVFSLFIILFNFSRFNFCSCDSVCSGLFGCVELPFSKVGGSFRLGCFCLLIFNVPGAVLLLCWLFIFWCISIISRSENQPFIIIVLTWSTSLWLLVWKLAHSCQTSILWLYQT